MSEQETLLYPEVMMMMMMTMMTPKTFNYSREVASFRQAT
jgi:hypothetical protein